MIWKMKERQRKWLAGEKGAIVKDWGGKLRVALAFPNRYAVGMSNLGLQSVYALLNGREDVVCERVFYPEPEDMQTLREHPGELLSVETQRPLRDFQLIAFSIPFENDYAGALEMLALAGLPLRAEQRGAESPLVAAGGVAVFLNPEPLAPFMDLFFIGEAEALLADFEPLRDALLAEDAPRPETLRALAQAVPGVYVPSLYKVVYGPDGAIEAMEPTVAGIPERIIHRKADLADHSACRTAVLTPNTEFGDMTLLEIGRGCGRGCRFCAAGFAYRPPRCHSAERLVEAARESGLEETPRVGLVSAAVSDHPEVDALCGALVEAGASLSFSSLRADAITPDILTALGASRRQAVAIAPEAGSERLRRVINKHLSVEQIYAAAEQLAEAGILSLKLYFMIGLPTETKEDIDAIVELAKGIKHHVLSKSRGRKQMGSITLSVNSFIPKPFTPFQWLPFAGAGALKEGAKRIQAALRKVPNVRVHFDMPKWSYIQALLARGDRRTGELIERVLFGEESWTQALKRSPHNPDFWVLRERGRDEVFPWEIIDNGVKRGYLWDELQRAIEARETPECKPGDTGCKRCGVCRS